jgi:hypothetical protein
VPEAIPTTKKKKKIIPTHTFFHTKEILLQTSKFSQEGYLLLDNRQSPGISKEFIQASGKKVPFVPEGTLGEFSTITCSHCHAIVILNPLRNRTRGYCAKCDHFVCDLPGCRVGCFPMKKVLDLLQEKLSKQTS